nr:site-2 protease family protein [Acanthopleuribacter pedis]
MLEFLGRFSEIFATLNLLLFVFNMIPVPPLDGAEIILLFFPEHRAEEIRHKLRGMGMIGFLVVFLVFPKIFSVVQRVAFTIFGF